MAALAFALAGGILAGGTAQRRAWIVVLPCVALAAILRRRGTVVLALAAATGLALSAERLVALDRSALAAGAANGADALLEGVVRGDPFVSGGAVRFVLDVRRAEIDRLPLRLRERALVTVRPPVALEPAAIVRVDARLRPVEHPEADAGARAAARRLRHRGVAARAYAPRDGLVVLGRSRTTLVRVAEAGRNAVRRAAAHLPERERALLLGVTIGDTSELDPRDDASFRTTGLAHLVAASGANVAYCVALVAFLLRRMRCGRRSTVAVLALTVLAFVAVARFEPSVVRAGAMAAIALAGVALGARRVSTVALWWAVIFVLLLEPFLLWSAGFQLSVLATLGLLVLSPRIAAALPPGKIAAAAAVTLGAQFAVAPLIVLLFGQISIVALPANLAVAPAVAPATVIGLVAALLGSLWSPLAACAWLARPALTWMLWVAGALAHLPLASLGTPRGLLATPVAVAATIVALRVARGRLPRARTVVLIVALLAAGGVWTRALSPPPSFRVVMLDVGQGDAFVVQAGDAVALIDGGPDPRVLLRALAAHGIRRIDLLVATHPHADHVDGFSMLARSFPVGRMLDPFTPSTLPSWEATLRALARRGVVRDRAVAGMRYRLGAAVIDVLWPPPERMTGTAEDVNNNSIVLRARFGAHAVLFAGETQEEAQEELLNADALRPGVLRATVLKVAHHGSRRMLPDFYRATGATIALIPVGRNTFGHPAPETLAALRDMRVLRSDRHGEVVVSVGDTPHPTVRTERAYGSG